MHKSLIVLAQAAQLGSVRHLAVGCDQAAQDALADAAIGHAKPVGRPDIEDRFQDGAACHHQVRPFAPDAGQFAALFDRHFGDRRSADGAHRIGRHDQPVDRAAIVLRQFQVQAGQRGHRAAGAQQAQRLLRLCRFTHRRHPL
jgi:hypothetical protein